MRAFRKLFSLSALVLAASVAPMASAAPTFYTSQLAFIAAAGPLSFESFEQGRSGVSIQYDGFQLAETNGANFVREDATVASTDGFRTANYIDNGDSVGVLSFDAPVQSIGFYLRSNSDTTVEVGGDISTVLTLARGTALFFGVIDPDKLQTLTFNGSGAPTIGFDAMLYSPTTSAVPEPVSWTMMIGGFGLIGAQLRRRTVRAGKAMLRLC